MAKKREPRPKFEKDKFNKATRVFTYMKPYRGRYFLGLAFLLVTSLVFLVFTKMTSYLVDSNTMIGGDDETVPFSWDTFDLALIIAGILIVQSVFSYYRIYLFAWVTENMLADLRLDVYKTLVRLPMEYFNNKPVGEINSRMSGDIAQIQETLTTTTAEFIRQSIIVVGGVILLFVTQVKLTLLMMGMVPLVAIFAVKFGRYIKSLSREVQDNVAASTNVVSESLTGIANVKAFTNEVYEFLRFKRSVEAIRKTGIRTGMWRAVFAAFIVICVFGAIMGIIVYATLLVQNDRNFTPGDFFMFTMLAIVIGVSFGGLSELYSSILKAFGAIERVFEIIDEKTEDIALKASENKVVLDGGIAFQDVSFHYPSRPDIQVLNKLSFQVNPGEQVAIVGPSGAGKSTITALIMRFYEIDSGKLLIDGKDSKTYNLTALRSNMAIVPQEVLLFGGSIAENIAYGKPEATLEEIKAAAQQANAAEFIERFPEQYDTKVGERGIQLSGGQRQRVAIARAVLNDPKILILDEATSSLDSESERLVQDALDKLMEGRTSVVIAHRLSTIKKADKIIVLDQGALKEIGTHEELMKNESGMYQHLSKLQFQN